MGNLSPTETKLTMISMSLIVLAGTALYCFAQSFNLFSLGEESAAQLGVEVELVKKMAFVLASLITGAAVSACGTIGFVGLIIPQYYQYPGSAMTHHCAHSLLVILTIVDHLSVVDKG